MKKIISTVLAISILGASSLTLVSCKNDVMSRTYKQRVDREELDNVDAQTIYINKYREVFNRYVRPNYEDVNNINDAIRLIQDTSYSIPRYVASDTKNELLRNGVDQEGVLKILRKVMSYYTIKTPFDNVRFEKIDDSTNKVTYRVNINLVSVRDEEFLDKWMDFDVSVYIQKFGTMTKDIVSTLESINHKETGLVWEPGEFDDEKGEWTTPGKWVETEESKTVYDFSSFNVSRNENKDGFVVSINDSTAVLEEVTNIKNLKDYINVQIGDKLKQDDLIKELMDKVDLSIKIKMQNDREFTDDETIISVKDLLSSSLIYVAISLKQEFINEENKPNSMSEFVTKITYPDSEEIGEEGNKNE